MPVTVEQIVRMTSQEFGLQPGALLSGDRHSSVALARHVAMYLARRHGDWSFPEIGRQFGGRDHTTVLAACEKIKFLLPGNPALSSRVNALSNALVGESGGAEVVLARELERVLPVVEAFLARARAEVERLDALLARARAEVERARVAATGDPANGAPPQRLA